MFHYKEVSPLGTVTKIREILAGLSLLPTEKWHNYIEGLYSLRLTFPGLPSHIGVNGKGISQELALASAYGELMERMQNQLLYPLFMYYDFDRELAEYDGFCFDPEERKLSPQKIIDGIPDDTINQLCGDTNLFKQSFTAEDEEEYICLPYYHYNSRKTIYFPKDSFFYYYGSNGMAAGNTLEEAMVQGLCEIYERYVMWRALFMNESFPFINRSILQDVFPDEYRIIRKIEEKTNFVIHVLDCSLNQHFPVIAIVVINKKNQKHFVRFGAYPVLRIALERCLTELMQGRNIQDASEMIDFRLFLDSDAEEEKINFHNIFRDGWGHYPNSFFMNKSVYSVDPEYLKKRFSSNKDSLKDLLKIIDDEGWHLFIRDVGFLSFPAVSMFIPGVSEVSKLQEDNIYSLNQFRKMACQLRSAMTLNREDMKKIIDTTWYPGVNKMRPDLIKLTNLPIDANHPYGKINTTLLAAIFYRTMDDYENTAKCLDEYIRGMGNDLSAEALSYFRCARDYMILCDRNGGTEDNSGVLSGFYDKETLDKTLKEFSETDYLLKELGVMPCPDCSSCPVRSACSYETIRGLHRRLKDEMKKNPRNQEELALIFYNLSEACEA